MPKNSKLKTDLNVAYVIKGYETRLEEHPFLNYIDFLNAELTEENWSLKFFDLIRWIPEQDVITAGVISPLAEAFYEGQRGQKVTPEILKRLEQAVQGKKITMGDPYGDEPTYKSVKRLHTDLRATLEAFLSWNETGDPKKARQALEEEIWDGMPAVTWELADYYPGLYLYIALEGIAQRVFFDLADLLRHPEWPNILGQCAYSKCKKFFIKSRSDQKFCSPSHRAMAWEPRRKTSRRK